SLQAEFKDRLGEINKCLENMNLNNVRKTSLEIEKASYDLPKCSSDSEKIVDQILSKKTDND
ncbi:unnamed protein product, partial [Brachionus calyciflorus]